MTKRVLILVEGQTEESFVKKNLVEIYQAKGLYIQPVILSTKRVKSGIKFKGGVTSFEKFRSDLMSLFHGAGSALVTTMLDYYGLPLDFPGMSDRPNTSVSDKVTHIEKQIAIFFGNRRNFVPFLAMHEFEAWIFSNTDILPTLMNAQEKKDDFAAIRDSVATPEDINDSPQTAPSKRILSMFPEYRKVLYGPMVLSEIGLDRIRKECPHFNSWLSKIDSFSEC